MSEQTEQTSDTGNARASRRAELEAELAALNDESEDEISEAIEEAAEEVSEAVEEATETAVEAIEEETGEPLSPEEVRILRGIIAAQVVEEEAPEVNVVPPPTPEETAEVVVEPDTAPVRTHWSERRVF